LLELTASRRAADLCRQTLAYSGRASSEAIGDRSGVITLSAGATRYEAADLRATELAPDLAPGTYAHVEVTDTGPGQRLQPGGRREAVRG